MTDTTGTDARPERKPTRDLSGKMLPLAGLVHHPENARVGDVEMIRESLRNHDQYAPVVVQKSTKFIIKGNHTYDALVAEGFTHGWVNVLDVSDEQAKRIMLMDNKSGEVGGYDEEKLMALLDQFDGDLTGTGYTLDHLEDLEHLISPPDIHALANDLGDPDPTAFWPLLRIQVDPALYRRWLAYAAQFGDDPNKTLDALLPPEPEPATLA